MDMEFIRRRITELRLKRGISEYQLSYDLGHSKNPKYGQKGFGKRPDDDRAAK